jgi:polysaccharide export outer membrane protein
MLGALRDSSVSCSRSNETDTMAGGGTVEDRIRRAFDGGHREAGAAVRIPRIEAAVALACLLALGCAAKLVPPPIHVASTYRVGPPDSLLVHILPEPAIERTVTVRPDGFISIDMIGDVLAAGRSVEEIAGDIQEKISRYRRDALVTVSLVEALSSSVTILGELREPGTLVVTRHTRITEAIGLRGGPTIFASKSRIRVVRSVPGHEAEVLYINLRHIEGGDLGTDIMLRDGDIVVVPPNALARFGYVLQTMLFPFQQILSAGTAVAATLIAF